eukprot:12466406-Ditylum_brightwellii.AAC.1
MRQRGELNPATIAAIHPGDEYLLPFVQTELQHQDKSITANDDDKHNYKDMVWNCTHLTVNQHHRLVNFFSDLANLFDGIIGTIPGKPVSLTLKPGAKPFCACALCAHTYTIPMAINRIAQDEIQKLCNLDVLGCGSDLPWGAPYLFQSKKNSDI